jgi:alpha-glucosidase
MKEIPSTWDETIALPGTEIGKAVAFARRKGDAWFIGVMNGPDATTLDLPLKFLARGQYQMIQLGDAADRDDAWQRVEKSVQRTDSVALALRRGGGCVIELKPKR